MKLNLGWIEKKFWWFWGVNLLLALLVVGAFVLGWIHETITAPNIPAWCGILLFVVGIVAGSVWLRRSGRQNFAVGLLMLLPVPIVVYVVGGFIFGIFYFIVAAIASLFGHGRVN